MTAADLITKAQHALRTDQPNLAMLYMERGLHEAMREGTDAWIDAYRARRKLPRGGVA